MASTAEELLVIARMRNELSRPLREIKGDMAGVRREIDSTGKATRQQSADLRILQREYDATSKRLGMMGQRATQLGRTFTRDLTLPIVFGFAAAGKAALDDNRSQAILANTLRNTVRATTSQVKATEVWIRRQQFATGISDNELRPALGKLTAAKMSTAKAEHVLNVAMDVSVARHKDLGSVVEALSKAHVGNTTALKRLGLQTTDAAGRALSFDQIVERLAKTYKGSMSEASDTVSGKLKRDGQRLLEFGEDIGNRLLPMLSKVASVAQSGFQLAGTIGPVGQDLFIFGGIALATLGPTLRLAGGMLTLAKAYREWNAARVAGGLTTGLAGLPGVGGLIGAAGGIGSAAGLALPFAIGGGLIASSLLDRNNQKNKGKKFAAGVTAPYDLTSGKGRASALRDLRSSYAAQNARATSLLAQSASNYAAHRPGWQQELGAADARNRAKAAKDEIDRLTASQSKAASNTGMLTDRLHMSRSEVERLAIAHGVDLSGALQSVTRDMRLAAQAARDNNEALSDQDQKYKDLKTSIGNLKAGRERLLDRFVSEKDANFSFADALGNINKGSTPRERAQNELAAFTAAQRLVEAGQLTGKVPNTQRGYLAALNSQVGKILARDPGDRAGLRGLLQQFAQGIGGTAVTDATGHDIVNVTVQVSSTASPEDAYTQAYQGADAALKAYEKRKAQSTKNRADKDNGKKA